MESWRLVWRNGFAPQYGVEELEQLVKGLVADDARILQGATCTPPPLDCVRDWPVEATCCITFGAWQLGLVTTVDETERLFARRCFDADRALAEPAACRWVLSWYDDGPRGRVFSELLAEVRRAIAVRVDPVAAALAASDACGADCVLGDYLQEHSR